MGPSKGRCAPAELVVVIVSVEETGLAPRVRVLGAREQNIFVGRSEHDSETVSFTCPSTGVTVIL
jgi:hypothetical protein